MLKILTIPLWLMLNPVHASMTSIEYVPGTDSLKVFCRMQYDNFLHDYHTIDDDRDLKTIFAKQPFPQDPVNKYFNLKVYIYVNNKRLTGKLLSLNLTDNEIVLVFYYKTDKKPKKITVRNMILTGWFSDQVNMVIVKADKFEKGVKLTAEHNEETFIIK